MEPYSCNIVNVDEPINLELAECVLSINSVHSLNRSSFISQSTVHDLSALFEVIRVEVADKNTCPLELWPR
jgi:hypothetical protein